MKMKFTIVFNLFISSLAFSQSDLGIDFVNYSNGTVTPYDTIVTDFIIHNNGNVDYHNGDTIYVSSRINNTYFGIDLLGTSTALVLDDHFHTGDDLLVTNGYLLGQQTLLFFPGSTTLDICVIVWGEGINSVDINNGTFPSDSDPSNNISCVTYDPSVMSISDNDNSLLSVFPNPTNDVLNFKNFDQQTAVIVVTNSLGQEVIKTNLGNSNNKIDVSSLDFGLYHFSMYDSMNNFLSNGRFVKE